MTLAKIEIDALFDRPPVCILGPTASGKSNIAMAVATAIGNVEIVSVDSMQVYRGMDIGTAKASKADQELVRHHLIDLADPADDFAVSMFQNAWRKVAIEIADRGAIPLLVGGTGLYLRAVIDALEIPGEYPEVRAALGERSHDLAGLYAELTDRDPLAASRIDPNNSRRILRALEVTVGAGRPFSSFGPGMEEYPQVPFRLLALRMNRERLVRRINARYEQQLQDGFLDEVRLLSQRARPIGRTARQALGYRELLTHVELGTPLADALEAARVRTRRFARRQMKWFERDPRIEWMDIDASGEVNNDAVIDRAFALVNSSR